VVIIMQSNAQPDKAGSQLPPSPKQHV
jgi:hypothetical protein